MNRVLQPYRRYADFSGRSCRTEYWAFTLMIFAITFAWAIGMMWIEGRPVNALAGEASMTAGQIALTLPFGLFWLVTFIPQLAVTVRRFHDSGRTGWLYLVVFLPVIGGLALLYFMVIDGTRGENAYGLDPKGRERLSLRRADELDPRYGDGRNSVTIR